MKFPCDICEKVVCFIFCDKFTEYAKTYPKSRKVKEKRVLLEEIRRMNCPWMQRGGHCGLYFNKPCVTERGACRDLERILGTLGKRIWNRNEAEFISKAYKTADHSDLCLWGWEHLLLLIEADPVSIRTRIGLFMMQECRKTKACPYKPLLPETTDVSSGGRQ